ncbi:MAG TPA: sigma-70 family RNA polymerase sigma factor [Terriglobales bacterium]|nr:sigma-70 family RNA polymerase sigma factor [Terriglobales bacterium]
MDDPQNFADEKLVALCQQGQRQCFEFLVQRYMTKAFHIAFNFTRDTETAKDLSQDAFMRAYANIKQFDGRSSFYTWFYRIVVNLCLDHARRRGRVAWQSLDDIGHEPGEQQHFADSTFAPDQEAMAGEAKRKVNATLEAMPKKQRTAFLLRNHQGLSITDIAEVMKTTEGTVRVYLHRAVAALRQSLVELV